MWGDLAYVELPEIMKRCSGSRVQHFIPGFLLHLGFFIKLLHLGIQRQYPIFPII